MQSFYLLGGKIKPESYNQNKFKDYKGNFNTSFRICGIQFRIRFNIIH